MRYEGEIRRRSSLLSGAELTSRDRSRASFIERPQGGDLHTTTPWLLSMTDVGFGDLGPIAGGLRLVLW